MTGVQNWQDHGTPEQDDPMVLIAIPSLASILVAGETKKGSPLSQAEVLQIRDRATCKFVSLSARRKLDEDRGYIDINYENVWDEWRKIREWLKGNPALNAQPRAGEH